MKNQIKTNKKILYNENIEHLFNLYKLCKKNFKNV